MQTGIHIGNVQGKETIKAVAEAVVEIMQQPVDQKTIRAGLAAFSKMAEIDSVTISDCTVTSYDREPNVADDEFHDD